MIEPVRHRQRDSASHGAAGFTVVALDEVAAVGQVEVDSFNGTPLPTDFCSVTHLVIGIAAAGLLGGCLAWLMVRLLTH